MSTSEYGTY